MLKRGGTSTNTQENTLRDRPQSQDRASSRVSRRLPSVQVSNVYAGDQEEIEAEAPFDLDQVAVDYGHAPFLADLKQQYRAGSR